MTGENCDIPIRASLTEASREGPSTAGVAAIVVSVLIIVALVVILVIVYYRRRLYRLKKELHQVVQYFPEAKDPTGQWVVEAAAFGAGSFGEEREEDL